MDQKNIDPKDKNHDKNKNNTIEKRRNTDKNENDNHVRLLEQYNSKLQYILFSKIN